MTKQEPTIDLLKSYIHKCEESLESTTDYALLGAFDRRIELLRYAIECIEKQIPLKGKERFVGNGWNDIWEGDCPKCGKTISPSKFCRFCGQSILWGSDNE